MLSLNFAKKLWQVPLLGGLGLCLGMQSASAISLTAPGKAVYNDTCSLSTATNCTYTFNYFDNSSTWINGLWAIKGRVTAAKTTLGSATGSATAGYVLTLTDAYVQYKGAAGTVGSITNPLEFSHVFDFGQTEYDPDFDEYYVNPYPTAELQHQLSGKFIKPGGSVNAQNNITSVISFKELQESGAPYTSGSTADNSFSNQLEVKANKAGTPSNSTFTFVNAMGTNSNTTDTAKTLVNLYKGKITVNVTGITLASGDLMQLPASDCAVLAPVNERGETLSSVEAESLCTTIAQLYPPSETPADVPEPSSVLGLLGAIAWGTGKLFQASPRAGNKPQ